MGNDKSRDFAALLDDLFAASTGAEAEAPRPTIPFDYLSVAEELHSGRIRVGDDSAKAKYRETAEEFEVDLAAFLRETKGEEAPLRETPPSIEPGAVALELRLDGVRDAAEFGRIRRAFAFRNHPDRVAPHLRQRAMVRMQIANMLIDDARRKALGKTR